MKLQKQKERASNKDFLCNFYNLKIVKGEANQMQVLMQ
jgi:hypothetical protein